MTEVGFGRKLCMENNQITVKPVRSKKELKQFIRLPWQLYKDDAAWVPPLLSEEKKRLDKKNNPFFEHADAEYFLAQHQGKVVGRISAQVDHLHNETHQEKSGFFGFFECINDEAVSKALLNTAASWLRSRGMKIIRGPYSFSINEMSGLLVNGYEHPPSVMMGHNPNYYEPLVASWGLQKVMDFFCWAYDSTVEIPEAALQIAEMVRAHPGLVVREVHPKHIQRDVALIFDVFNSAWQNNWGFVPLTQSELAAVVKDFKLILEPKLALIAEVDGQPAAIALALPNVNSAIADLNGRLFPFGFLKLLYRLKRKKIKTARLMLLGVKKEFRGDILGGLSVLLYTEMHRRSQLLGHIGGELSWTLEDNEKINVGIQMMGGQCYKTYRVYEKTL